MNKFEWYIGIYFLMIIILDAVKDGVRDRGLKTTAGIIRAIWLAFILAGLYVSNTDLWPIKFFVWPPLKPGSIWWLILSYIFLRFALFNLVWNFTRGGGDQQPRRSIFYIGDTKWMDRKLKAFYNRIHFNYESLYYAIILTLILFFGIRFIDVAFGNSFL